MIRCGWFAGGIAVILPLAARAQSARLSLDVGSSSLRYADSIEATTASVTPSFQLANGVAFVGGTGTLSQMSGATSYSGTIDGGLSTPAQRRLSLEASVDLGGSSHSDGARTGQVLGNGRLYVNGSRAGAWGGASYGRTWDGLLWRDVVQGSAGGWIGGSAGSLVVSLAPTSVDDTIQYADAVVAVQRETRRTELALSVGSRLGEPVPSLLTDRAWASVSGVLWVTPHVGIVASGGTYPIDFTQGYPGGRFVSLGLRLAAGRAVAGTAAPPPDRWVDPAARAFEVRPSGGMHRLRVQAPGATRVEISGDFTQWDAVSLTPEGNGWWSVTLPCGHGSHQVNLRVNGGAWTVPPGLTPIRDEFGGASGLLVIA